jgi:hypothetical protein
MFSTLGVNLNKGSFVKVFIIKSFVVEVSCVGKSCGRGSAGKGNFAGALWEAGVFFRRRGIIVGLHCRMQGVGEEASGSWRFFEGLFSAAFSLRLRF